MTLNYAAPWHRASYERFLREALPALLAARLPLAEYAAVCGGDSPQGGLAADRLASSEGQSPWAVTVAVAGKGGEVRVTYANLPFPDADGVFRRNGRALVVVPETSSHDLATAEVRCAGELALAYVAARLGEAAAELPWDEALLRAWLPLDAWLGDFLQQKGQAWDEYNWLSRQSHLRRILLPERQPAWPGGSMGRVCPFETPEGPNISRVLPVAMGAEIHNGRLVMVDERPEATLGLGAHMVPLLGHDDANRALMGMNMMRQWEAPPDPEPALVRTGFEVDAPEFWCGRNLLTAYMSWGTPTYEDACVLSASAAARLAYPWALEPGDKLSNRHGTKTTVGAILPDAEMPRLGDGTPIDIVFSALGVLTRMNVGQLYEAALGRVAHAEGQPIVAPPFAGPTPAEIQARLTGAGFRADGLEQLLRPDGTPLEYPTQIGYVYWGKLHHLAARKIHAWPSHRGQGQGELEFQALRDANAHAYLLETFNTRAVERPDADALAERLAAGPVSQAAPPTPSFAKLQRRLAACGIMAEFDGHAVRFRLPPPLIGERGPGGEGTLARPVAHPWLPGRTLAAVGLLPDVQESKAVELANARLARLLAGGMPAALVAEAEAELTARVAAYLEALVPKDVARPHARVAVSGRAVISPATGLRSDQIGLPNELAWALFGPMVAREVGREATDARTAEAATTLDRLMADAWVVVNRAPTIGPMNHLAFRPVRHAERVIRIHPLALMLQNADFDGDQMAVFLPITPDGQRDAAERLSLAGHLRRDPSYAQWMIPHMDMIWGLARLCLTAAGHGRVEAALGGSLSLRDGVLHRDDLRAALRARLDADGPEAMLAAAERLMALGFEAVQCGASQSAFLGMHLAWPDAPTTTDGEAWRRYGEAVSDLLLTQTDFDDPTLGPQLLAARSGARGNLGTLQTLLGGRRVQTLTGLAATAHGFVAGLTVAEALDTVIGARKGLYDTLFDWMDRTAYGLPQSAHGRGATTLARALRATAPGPLFARAAANEEIDPLTDPDARLFLGLMPL